LVEGLKETHHVLQVDEGIVDGNNFDSLLQAGPEDQAANTAKSGQRGKGWIQYRHRVTWDCSPKNVVKFPRPPSVYWDCCEKFQMMLNKNVLS
jgi:hypothetical protein